MNKTLISKFLLFSYGTWVSLVIGLFTVAITTRILPPDVFGKASLFTTLVSLLVVLSMVGADQAYVRFYYELDQPSRKLLLLKCISFPLVVIVLIWGILFLKYREISFFIFGEVNFLAIVILSLSLIFEVFHRYSLLLLRLKQYANKYSIIIIISKVLELIIIVSLYYLLGISYIILPLSFMLASFLVSLGTISITLSDWNFKSLSRKHKFDTPKAIDIFRYSYPLMFSLILHWAFTSIDKIALTSLSTFFEVGIYASAGKLIFLMTAVQSAFTTFWTPISLERFSIKADDFAFFKKASRIISLLVLVLMVLLIMSKDVFVYILGKEYVKSGLLMPFAIFGPAMYTISETTVVGIAFSKKTKWNILISFIVSVINILGNLLLIPSLGALGASISTSVSYVIFLFLRTIISKRLYPVSYPIKELSILSVLIFAYASYVSFFGEFFLNIVIGLLVIIVILFVFGSETQTIWLEFKKKIYDIINTRKIS